MLSQAIKFICLALPSARWLCGLLLIAVANLRGSLESENHLATSLISMADRVELAPEG